MNEGEIITLLEVLQSNVEGFDQMQIDCIRQQDETSMDTQTEELETPPQINQQNAVMFKTLDEEDLHQIEQNQYSEQLRRTLNGA
jgi:hypothetical protein